MQPHSNRSVNSLHATTAAAALLALVALAPGCATSNGGGASPSEDLVVYHRAESARADQLAREVERLREDIRRAEEALVSVESGLKGKNSHANAVSALAEARILVKRAARSAPWRAAEIREAGDKLAEAELQIEQDYPGSALFFIYRARRIAEVALLEAESVEGNANTWFTAAEQVNLRSGPTTRDSVRQVLGRGTPVFPERSEGGWMLVRVVSGPAGWIHASLLER